MYIHMHIYKNSLYMYVREIYIWIFLRKQYICVHTERARGRDCYRMNYSTCFLKKKKKKGDLADLVWWEEHFCPRAELPTRAVPPGSMGQTQPPSPPHVDPLN